MARKEEETGRGGCRVQEPPLLGAVQGNQVALARRGSCEAGEPGRGLTPGRGGEEGEVCAAGAHSLAGNVGTPHGPAAPVPGTNSKTTCFLLLTPGAQPAPPNPPPHPGSGSARGMKASGSSGSRLGDRKGPGGTRLGWP